jgi:catechol 2,3-dioxygenase-like lactoylglutathione lyase family enzyme
VITALNELEVITLFVENLQEAKAFYTDVFGLQVLYEDHGSAVIQLKNAKINLLVTSEAHGLIAPTLVAAAGTGNRALFTINVPDVDAVVAELEQHGVHVSNGPTDQPWGRRTASFADPAGHVWEIAQVLSDP